MTSRPSAGSQNHVTPSKTAPAITTTPPTPQRPPEQLKRDLQYLKDHKICEKLEFIVKSLLNSQPEDPVLAICSLLRESTHGGKPPGGRGASILSFGTAPCASPSASCSPAGSPVDAHGPDFAVAGADAHARGLSADARRPSEQITAAGLRAAHSSSSAAAATAATASAAAAAAAAPSVACHPHHQHHSAGLSSCAPPPPPDGHHGSRVGTPGSASGGVGLVPLSRRDSLSVISNDTLGRRVERGDESTRSEASVFSAASVDVAEFLGEFRAAHYSLFGDAHELVTKNELADIVDRVMLPLPDARTATELFGELDDGSGRISFQAFLARMNFRIQGRYPLEVIRGLYFSLLERGRCAARNEVGGGEPHVAALMTTTAALVTGARKGTASTPTPLSRIASPGSSSDLTAMAASSGKQQQQQQKPCSPLQSPLSTALSAGSDRGGTRSGTATTTHATDASGCFSIGPSLNPCGDAAAATAAALAPSTAHCDQPPRTTAEAAQASLAKCYGGGLPMSDALHTPSSTATTTAAVAATTAGATTALSAPPAWAAEGLTRRQCLEDGLWRGLGLRVGSNEFARVARSLGIAEDDEGCLFHVADFTKIVLSLTGQTRDPLEISDNQQPSTAQPAQAQLR